MNPTPALSSLQNSSPLLAILWAGLTCGTLDIAAGLVVYGQFVREQFFLAAAAQNIKRLVRFLSQGPRSPLTVIG
jgi:hypothetical protein